MNEFAQIRELNTADRVALGMWAWRRDWNLKRAQECSDPDQRRAFLDAADQWQQRIDYRLEARVVENATWIDSGYTAKVIARFCRIRRAESRRASLES